MNTLLELTYPISKCDNFLNIVWLVGNQPFVDIVQFGCLGDTLVSDENIIHF